MKRAWLLVLCAACGGARVQRPYPPPEAVELARHVAGIRERAKSLRAETRSDFRLGKDRVNLTVFMLAAWGGKLRFQAMNPNNSTAADLASDGKKYCFMDVQANCAECGPATAESVARLLQIRLEPDQVVAVLLGSAPLLDTPPTVGWNERGGHEVLTFSKDGWTERVELDGKDKVWDVLEAELKNPQGEVAWTLRHKDFRSVEGVRLPQASLFEQGGGETVRIIWKEQKVGETIPDEKFRFDPPPGLPTCQRK